jgi:hypothetical protein
MAATKCPLRAHLLVSFGLVSEIAAVSSHEAGVAIRSRRKDHL